MKKLIFCICFALVCFASNAQVKNPIIKKSYRELSTMYDPHEYVATFSDRYSPAWSGVASFFIPGLGDAICGEWGRAAIQFFGSEVLASIGSGIAAAGSADDNTGAAIAALACLTGALAIDIWSICDAVKVAKVKNMYYQAATMTSSLDIKLAPSFAYVNTGNGAKPTTGFSLSVAF